MKWSVLIVVALVVGVVGQARAQYSYTTLDDPLGVNTSASGISGNNIVGSYTDGTGDYGFLYNINTNSYTTLNDPLGTLGTVANGIDGNRSVGSYRDTHSRAYGFLYNGTSYTTLDVPGENNGTFANGISGNNIVGFYLPSGDPLGALNLGFLYDNGTFYTIRPYYGYHGLNSEANGIDGSHSVGAYTYFSPAQGFLYDMITNSYTTLDDPLATNGTVLNGISGNTIVGGYEDGTGDHGFLYDGTSYTTLDDPLATKGTFANGINGNNIVGYYIDATGNHGFIATPTPEPSTLALLGVGAFGLLRYAVRQRKKSA